MMLQQRGFAVLQRHRDMLRQFAGAEGGIGRAGDRIPAGRGDHIVNGRDGPVEDRHRRTMDTGIPYEKLTEDKIVFIDADGQHEQGKLPSSEWRFHQAAYQTRPDAQAVVHNHA